AASHGCKEQSHLRQASLERDAGRFGFSASVVLRLPRLPKSPSASSPLGGCPASCPDTYRLTHDHRHVRNWARLEIRLLISLRNNFFRLGRNFSNVCLRKRSQRAPLTTNMNGR